MFFDNQIAQDFHLGSDKLSYLTECGPALYFKVKLKKNIKDSQFISISFDESLN